MDQHQIHDVVDLLYTDVQLAPGKNLAQMLKRTSHVHLMNFRKFILETAGSTVPHAGLTQYDGPVLLNRKFPKRESPNFAYYQVRELLGKEGAYQHRLVCCHGNLHGLNNQAFKEVYVDERSMEISFQQHFAGKLLRGDIVKVYQFRNGSPMYVHDYIIMDRQVLDNCSILITNVDGAMKLISPGQPMFGVNWVGVNHLPEVSHRDTLWNGVIFIPLANPFVYSKCSLKQFEEDDRKYIEKLLTDPTWINQFVVLEATPDEAGLEKVRNWRTICRDGIDKEKRREVRIVDLIAITAAQLIGREKMFYQFHGVEYRMDGDCIRFDLPYDFSKTIGLLGAEVELYHRDQVLKIKIVSSQVSVPNTSITVRGRRINRYGTVEIDELNVDEYPIVAELMTFDGIDYIDAYNRAAHPINGKNAEDTIIRMHGGNPRHPVEQYHFDIDPNAFELTLNPQQVLHIRNVMSGLPIMMTFAPFGCGKSLAIVAALMHNFNLPHAEEKDIPVCLMMARSNYAVGNLMRIAAAKAEHLGRMVRYVSKNVYDRLPEEERTEYDLPVLLGEFYTDVINDWENGQATTEAIIAARDYCNKYRRMGLMEDILGRRGAERVRRMPRSIEMTPEAYYLKIKKPKLIFCTIDLGLTSVADNLNIACEGGGTILVTNIQIDESSQVPVFELICVIRMYLNASIVIVGDRHQLGPYIETGMSPFLQELAMTSALDAFRRDAVVSVELLTVYRCDAHNTMVASRLFYERVGYTRLISGADSEYKRRRRMQFDFFGNGQKSITFVDQNRSISSKQGTSYVNYQEIELVKNIVRRLENNRHARCWEIGVISMYKAQSHLLDYEFPHIKTGTVDAFQGCEREFIVVCLTKSDSITDFASSAQRVNVAITRAKIGLIIVGRLEAASNTQYWREIAQDHCNIVDADMFNTGWRSD